MTILIFESLEIHLVGNLRLNKGGIINLNKIEEELNENTKNNIIASHQNLISIIHRLLAENQLNFSLDDQILRNFLFPDRF